MNKSRSKINLKVIPTIEKDVQFTRMLIQFAYATPVIQQLINNRSGPVLSSILSFIFRILLCAILKQYVSRSTLLTDKHSFQRTVIYDHFHETCSVRFPRES